MNVYSDDFYRYVDETALPSARQIVPMVTDLLSPRSVVDLGCGNGAWLSVFRQNGVEEVLGIDGDWVHRTSLHIAPEDFHAARLDRPLVIPRRFDLAISLEVAEHLPPESAEGLVATLTEIAPVVMFSAAIPGQGGTRHINERWPAYWIALFRAHGYEPIDAIRPAVWANPAVAWWYAQNILIFTSEQAIRDNVKLAEARDSAPREPPTLVHPELHEIMRKRSRPGFMSWLKLGGGALGRSLHKALRADRT